MDLVKDDSHITSKEEGAQRLLSLITAYRADTGMHEWDHEKSDGENHDIVAAAVPHDKHGKRKKTSPDDDEGTQVPRSGSQPLTARVYLTVCRLMTAVKLVEANLKPNKSANFFVQFIVLLAR